MRVRARDLHRELEDAFDVKLLEKAPSNVSAKKKREPSVVESAATQVSAVQPADNGIESSPAPAAKEPENLVSRDADTPAPAHVQETVSVGAEVAADQPIEDSSAITAELDKENSVVEAILNDGPTEAAEEPLSDLQVEELDPPVPDEPDNTENENQVDDVAEEVLGHEGVDAESSDPLFNEDLASYVDDSSQIAETEAPGISPELEEKIALARAAQNHVRSQNGFKPGNSKMVRQYLIDGRTVDVDIANEPVELMPSHALDELSNWARFLRLPPIPTSQLASDLGEAPLFGPGKKLLQEELDAYGLGSDESPPSGLAGKRRPQSGGRSNPSAQLKQAADAAGEMVGVAPGYAGAPRLVTLGTIGKTLWGLVGDTMEAANRGLDFVRGKVRKIGVDAAKSYIDDAVENGTLGKLDIEGWIRRGAENGAERYRKAHETLLEALARLDGLPVGQQISRKFNAAQTDQERMAIADEFKELLKGAPDQVISQLQDVREKIENYVDTFVDVSRKLLRAGWKEDYEKMEEHVLGTLNDLRKKHGWLSFMDGQSLSEMIDKMMKGLKTVLNRLVNRFTGGNDAEQEGGMAPSM